MSSLRIYGIARTRAFRALWVAKELGLDYEHLPIEIGDAGARAPEFLAINPNGRLPFIDDDGFVLFESLAITLYLAKKHSPRKTLSRHAAKRGEGLAVELLGDRRGRSRRQYLVAACRAAAGGERNAAKRDEALKVIAAPFKVLDAAVAAEPYLLGDDFTVADLNVAAVISRAIDMDFVLSAASASWLTRCLDRPAARAALALKTKPTRETPAEVTRRIAQINRL